MVLGKQQFFSAVPVQFQAKPEYSRPPHHLGHRHSRSFQTAPPCGSCVFDIEGAYGVTWRHVVFMKTYNYGIRGAMGYFYRTSYAIVLSVSVLEAFCQSQTVLPRTMVCPKVRF